jgi:hypothetical protein
MSWNKPEFIEVDMSAEIGGYQGEDSDIPPNGPDPIPDFVESAEDRA